MRKLTAGIFSALLVAVTAGAANAEIASKNYVDTQDGAIMEQLGQKADKTTVGELTNLTSGISQENVVSAINSVYTKAQDADIIANEAKGIADTNKNAIGTLTSLTTSAQDNLVNAINEVKTTADRADQGSGEMNAQIGNLQSLTTDAKDTLVNAINEVDAHADAAQLKADNADRTAGEAKGTADANKIAIGTLESLTTSEKNNLVGAVNEVKTTADNADRTAGEAKGTADANKTAIGTLDTLTTTEKTNLVGAVNEVKTTADNADRVAGEAMGLANNAIPKPAAECSNTGNKCVLVTNGSQFEWEVIARGEGENPLP